MLKIPEEDKSLLYQFKDRIILALKLNKKWQRLYSLLDNDFLEGSDLLATDSEYAILILDKHGAGTIYWSNKYAGSIDSFNSDALKWILEH